MRDNQDRFGDLNSPDVTADVEQTNPTLSFVSPTEIVDLPSAGKYYPEGHCLCGKSSVEIKFMTAKEEDILTNKSLIKKGVVIDRLLESIVVDKSVKIEDLLVGDKNALLLAARISGYGPDYSISVTCPICQDKSQQTMNLEEVENKQLVEPEQRDVKMPSPGLFSVVLPKSKVEVVFRLLNGKDEAEITKKLISNKMSDSEANSTSQLKRLLVSANGVTDRQVLNEFSNNMPAIDARFLRNLVKDLSPDVDMMHDFSCSSCGHGEEVEIPFTVEFFWPK